MVLPVIKLRRRGFAVAAVEAVSGTATWQEEGGSRRVGAPCLPIKRRRGAQAVGQPFAGERDIQGRGPGSRSSCCLQSLRHGHVCIPSEAIASLVSTRVIVCADQELSVDDGVLSAGVGEVQACKLRICWNHAPRYGLQVWQYACARSCHAAPLPTEYGGQTFESSGCRDVGNIP